MMDIQVVAFDMDGTLLNSQRQIPKSTIQALNALHKKHETIKIILVTGRHHLVVRPYHWQLKLETPVICCNGSYLYDFKQEKTFFENAIPKNKARKVLQLARENGITVLIYADNSMYYEEVDDYLSNYFHWVNSVPEIVRPKLTQINDFSEAIERSDYIFKFATQCDHIEKLTHFQNAMIQELGLNAEWSWTDRVDVVQKGNTKGSCLKKWLDQEKIDLKNVAAFGDNDNDLSMLTEVGLGIAMGNSIDKVKAKISCVIGDNNSNAIAKKLIELFNL